MMKLFMVCLAPTELQQLTDPPQIQRKEKMRRKFSRGKVGDDQGTYSAYTRQASNFVFPHINIFDGVDEYIKFIYLNY